MNAYKLLKKRRDGTLGPLFINASQRIPFDEWLEAEDHPTKGYAHRPYWHSTYRPEAKHLKLILKSGERRVWCEVKIEDYVEQKRSELQGGLWYLSNRIKIIKELAA